MRGSSGFPLLCFGARVAGRECGGGRVQEGVYVIDGDEVFPADRAGVRELPGADICLDGLDVQVECVGNFPRRVQVGKVRHGGPLARWRGARTSRGRRRARAWGAWGCDLSWWTRGVPVARTRRAYLGACERWAGGFRSWPGPPVRRCWRGASARPAPA